MSDQPLARHEVAGWVRAQRLAPAAKLVLLLIFDHAGPQEDGRWVAWVGNANLAYEAGFAEGANGARTVRKHLADLESLGILTREERSRPNGSQTTSRVVLLVREDHTIREGGSHDPGGEDSTVPPISPSSKPKRSPTTEQNARERARKEAQKLPENFPEDLKPHARRVFAVLRDLAEQHNAKEVTPRGVGLAIMGHPGRRFIGVAYDLASWGQSPPRPIKDVVNTYRTFLDGAPVCAGIEPIDVPVTAGSAGPRVGRTRDGWTGADIIAIGRRRDQEARERGELIG